MPTIEQFKITNFKGIHSAKLNLSSRMKNKVLTLIGLNESGKTTVLEAISYFVSSETDNKTLFEGPYSQKANTSLIPVHRQAAFTDSIVIEASVKLEKSDKQAIIDIYKTDGYVLLEADIPDSILAKRNMQFKDSTLISSSNTWSDLLNLKVKKEKERKKFEYKRPTDGKNRDLWLEAVNIISQKLPKVNYFPTFLVDFPTKIYLQEHEKERPVNRFYRNVIQEIISSIDSQLDLDTHVVKRISDFKKRDGSPSWFSKFHSHVDRLPVESVFQKISSAITKEVLGNWQKVFNTPVNAKQITVSWNIDAEYNDMPYCTFNVSDGESLYAIDQRSLGFRWFFSFLLFTRFKATKDHATIFLFDEPAANLHARAQAQLLETFERIVEAGNIVFYSTHSHHMINPRWLGGAFIVENEAVDYDRESVDAFNVRPTKIKVTNYRDFVSQQPNRLSYFQPVLERLQYQEPAIASNGSLIMLEGVSDFCLFEFVRLKSGKFPNIRFLPGYGASSLDNAIGRALSEGRKFQIVLDDDKAGKSSKVRYLEKWYLPEHSVKTLGDVSEDFLGKKLEDLLNEKTIENIKNNFGGKSGKKQIGYYLAESLASLTHDAIDETTFQSVLSILDTLNSQFEDG